MHAGVLPRPVRLLTSVSLALFAAGPGTSQVPALPGLPDELSAADWEQIRSVHETARYAVRSESNGHWVRNGKQAWHTEFDGSGFRTRPDSGDWTWGLELERYGFSNHMQLVPERASTTADGTRLTYHWNDDLDEWFVNDGRGLEHGYNVHSRPPREPEDSSRSPLTFALRVRGSLSPVVAANGRDVRFLDRGGRVAVTYSGLTVFDAQGKDVPARFHVEAGELILSVEESEAAYPLTIDPIAQQAYLKASNTDASDYFGRAVAVSGDTVVIGATGEDSTATSVNGDESDNGFFPFSAGAAYVFVRQGAVWTQEAYLKPSGIDALDEFGLTVAISGDTVVVGAPTEDSNATGVNGNDADNSAEDAGAAYVFVRNGTTWTQEAYLKASNADARDQFGHSVSVSGDTILVGAYKEDSNATGVNGDEADNSILGTGAAYVFVRSGTTWTQDAYLKATETDTNDRFGWSVAVSGDTAIVGAYKEDSSASIVNGNQADDSKLDAGAAYVFTRSGTTWTQEAYLKASNSDFGDFFGWSVALDGETAVVGSLREDSNATGVDGDQNDETAISCGAAYVFARSGSTWSQEAYLKGSTSDVSDTFGASVSVAGDVVVVGASGNDDLGEDTGAAYLFERSGTTWAPAGDLRAASPGVNDALGLAVAVSDSVVVAGAFYESSAATGVNGDPLDNSMGAAGAAYVFDLDGIGVYGCGTNPAGSISVASGTPSIGSSMDIGVDNPLATQAVGSFPFLAVAKSADPAQPCGTPLPGWGMSGPGASGELLISLAPPNPILLLVGAPWTGAGTPAAVTLTFPNNGNLVGRSFFVQGVLFDPTVTFGVKLGLTNALELVVDS